MTLLRATLVSFDAGTYRASVRLDGSEPQVLDDIQVSGAIGPADMAGSNPCLIDPGETGEVEEWVIVALGRGVNSRLFDDAAGDPADVGTAADGTSTAAARRDHAHAGVAVLSQTGTLLDHNNSSSPTNIFSATIPAGALATNRAVELLMVGDILNNTGSGRTVQFVLKYGSTNLYVDTTLSLATSASRRPFWLHAIMGAGNSASVQELGGLVMVGVPGATTTGLGDMAGAGFGAMANIQGSAAENSASALAFALDVVLSTNSTNLGIRRRYAALKLL